MQSHLIEVLIKSGRPFCKTKTQSGSCAKTLKRRLSPSKHPRGYQTPPPIQSVRARGIHARGRSQSQLIGTLTGWWNLPPPSRWVCVNCLAQEGGRAAGSQPCPPVNIRTTVDEGEFRWADTRRANRATGIQQTVSQHALQEQPECVRVCMHTYIYSFGFYTVFIIYIICVLW